MNETDKFLLLMMADTIETHTAYMVANVPELSPDVARAMVRENVLTDARAGAYPLGEEWPDKPNRFTVAHIGRASGAVMDNELERVASILNRWCEQPPRTVTNERLVAIAARLRDITEAVARLQRAPLN